METSLQDLNRNQLVQIWSERVKQCRNSNLNVVSWCKQNNVKVSTYYAWQKRLFEAATTISQNAVTVKPAKAEFVEIPTAKITGPSHELPAATIVVGQTSVDIYNGIKPELLQVLLRGLHSC